MEQTRRRAAKEQRRAHWRAVVADAAASGLSIRQFCERDSINESHFYHWRRRLELEDRAEVQNGTAAKAEARFALVRTEPRNCSAHADLGEIELLLDRGWLLRIRRGVDEATLCRVLAAVAAAR